MAKTRLIISIAFVVVLALLAIVPGAAAAAPLDSPQATGSNWSACWYRVRWGDSLGNIAFHYHTSVWHLAAMNHIRNVNKIFAGMWLQVPCVVTRFKSFPKY